MSFYTESRPGIFPGQTNNITNGLCERISIQATKVFDACMNQTQLENYQLTLTDFNPANPTTPLTFISGNSLGGKVEFEISGQKLKGVLNNYDKKISKVK